MRPLASATAHDIALTTHWSSSSSMRGNHRKWPQWGRFGNHHRCRHHQHWRYLCRSDRGRYTEKGNVSNTIPRPKSAESRGRQPQQHRIIPVPKFSIDLFEKRKAVGEPWPGQLDGQKSDQQHSFAEYIPVCESHPHGSRACGSRVDGCRIASVGLKFRRSQFLSRNSGNMWQFRRVSVRKMIPFSEKGIIKQFHCSKCDWTLDLECPFLYCDHARRAEESHKAKHWYSAHDCSRFQKPAKRSEKS